jgi:hypothetical protein
MRIRSLVQEYSFDIPDITQINYLIKARREKMQLIEGDSETFKSILALMDDYEGLLQSSQTCQLF